MRVLVTGSSGKAGRFAVTELAQAGHEVFHIDRVRPAVTLPGEFRLVDLTDAGEVYDACSEIRAEGVCHIAANPSPEGFPRQQIFQNNVMSTYNVMQAACDSGSRRIIYASSEMATGWLTTDAHPARFPFNESDRVPSPNAYALSKYMGEMIADTMSARHPDVGFVSLRINNVIMPDGYDVLERRRRNYPTEGSGNYWSYIDVRDVATAFRAALEGESSGHEVFLIAAADTCIDVPIRKAMKARYNIEPEFAPGHGDFDSVFDCSKIRRAFGWSPKQSWRNQ